MLLNIIKQPDIHLLGLRIQDPMTTLTDVLVTAVCFFAYWKLNKSNLQGKTINYIKYYFVLIGIATLLGGLIGHAFQHIIPQNFKLLGWITSMFAVMFIERSAIEYAVNLIPKKVHNVLLKMNIIELVIVLLSTIYTFSFKLVELHAFYGFIIVVLSIHLYIYYHTKNKGSMYFFMGIAVLVIALLAFNYPIVPHVWFNHADLSHVLMAISSYLFLKGSLYFGTLPEIKSA